MNYKPAAQLICPWLKANLGAHCFVVLTGSDRKALLAAVQVIEQYAYDPPPSLIEAFRHLVLRMQPSTRELAYHSIAQQMNWSDRSRIWAEAGLPHIIPRRCIHE